jgi:hypothetical protein
MQSNKYFAVTELNYYSHFGHTLVIVASPYINSHIYKQILYPLPEFMVPILYFGTLQL